MPWISRSSVSDKMALSSFLVLMGCAWLASATYSRLQWSNCGSDPHVSVDQIEVTPMPILMPGPIQLSVKARMDRSIEDLEIQLNMKRRTFIVDLPIPCFSRIGSCTYQMSCSGESELNTMVTENWAGIMGDLGRQIQTMITSLPDLNATVCPIPPAAVDLQHYTINLPEVPSSLSFFAAGDYSVKANVRDKKTGRTFLCLEFQMSLKKKDKPCYGFFCGLG